jgi:hypothetical protein
MHASRTGASTDTVNPAAMPRPAGRPRREARRYARRAVARYTEAAQRVYDARGAERPTGDGTHTRGAACGPLVVRQIRTIPLGETHRTGAEDRTRWRGPPRRRRCCRRRPLGRSIDERETLRPTGDTLQNAGRHSRGGPRPTAGLLPSAARRSMECSL